MWRSNSPLPIDPKMVVTTDTIPGFSVQRTLGVSEGLSILFYTGLSPAAKESVFTDAMREAFMDMITKAANQGANAIVGLRYSTPSGEGMRGVLAYGTAVVVERN